MSRAGRIALCSFAAAAAIGGWFAFRGEPRASPLIAAIPDRSTPNEAGAPPADEIVPEPRPTMETEVPIVQADRVVVSDASNAARRAEVSVILKGHIESPRSDLERAVVTVQGEAVDEWNISGRVNRGPSSRSDAPRARAEVRHDGTFEVDVTAIARGVKELRVIAKHPNLKPRVELVATRPAVAGSARERVELFVELKMLDAACTVRGRIVAPGDPRATFAVTAFVVQGDTLASQIGEAVDVDKDGNFETSATAGVDQVLLAQAEDWRPATIRLRCLGAESIELGSIELERGVSISGQVLLGTAPFGTGMLVSANLADQRTLVQTKYGVFAWCGDRFEWIGRSTRAKDLGLYELTALGRCAYSVRVLSVEGFSPIQGMETISVLAPASDVDFAPKVCELHVAIFEGGAPAHVQFLIRQHLGADSVYYADHTTDESGRATVWLVPGRVTEVVIGANTPRERDYAVPDCAPDAVTEMRIDM